MPAVTDLFRDLAAEHADLDDVVAGLAPQAWAAPTPAAGWDVRDSISHLCFFDEMAVMALTDPERFDTHRAGLLATMTGAAGAPGPNRSPPHPTSPSAGSWVTPRCSSPGGGQPGPPASTPRLRQPRPTPGRASPGMAHR
jgi:Mycothiol maleylpyruvate isomerase N-terminal domain